MTEKTAPHQAPGTPVTHSVPAFSGAAVVASCIGFVLIGALQALYGPAPRTTAGSTA